MRLINADALKNAKPEFMNEKVVRDTKYRTSKDRIYAKAWNACNDYWLNTINNAPTVEYPFYQEAYQTGYEEGKNAMEKAYRLLSTAYEYEVTKEERPQGKWIKIFENPFTNGYKCPFCGHEIHVTEQFLPKVTECEGCGAQMFEEDKA